MNLSHSLKSRAVLGATLICLAGCAGSKPSLEGAWRKLPVNPDGAGPEVVKILADGHFAFGVQSEDGTVAYAGGGTYQYDGHKYVETVAYHWAQALVGATIEFDCVIKDDIWYHKARFEAKGERFNIDERWQRVPAPPGR